MRHIIGTIIGLGLFATGCQNKLYEENTRLHAQNRELQQQLGDSRSKLSAAPDPTQLASMQATMDQEIKARDARIAELQAQLNKPAANSSPEETGLLKDIEVTRDDRAGTMTVNVPGDVLFASGSAELKQSARATLNKITSAIKQDYSGKKVIVRGFTDVDPISKTKKKWTDNLDLSAARSRAVRKYLVDQGLDSKAVGLQAFGDTMPRNNKERSRRVEIVIATR